MGKWYDVVNQSLPHWYAGSRAVKDVGCFARDPLSAVSPELEAPPPVTEEDELAMAGM